MNGDSETTVFSPRSWFEDRGLGVPRRNMRSPRCGTTSVIPNSAYSGTSVFSAAPTTTTASGTGRTVTQASGRLPRIPSSKPGFARPPEAVAVAEIFAQGSKLARTNVSKPRVKALSLPLVVMLILLVCLAVGNNNDASIHWDLAFGSQESDRLRSETQRERGISFQEGYVRHSVIRLLIACSSPTEKYYYYDSFYYIITAMYHTRPKASDARGL